MTEQEYEQKIQELEQERAKLIEVIQTYENMNVIQTMHIMLKKYEELEKKFKATAEKITKMETFMNKESGINGAVTKRLEEAIKNNQDIEEEIVLKGGSSDAISSVMSLMNIIRSAQEQSQSTINND